MYIYREWTQEEDDFLRENRHVTIEELAKKIDRTPSAIRTRFKKLKVRRCRLQGVRAPMLWDDDDTQFLINNFQDLSIDKIAAKLGRSNGNVSHKAKLLGLKKEVKDYIKYFDRPCDEEYAYVLGWLFADGSFRDVVSITLKKDDALHLRPHLLNIYPWSEKDVVVKNYPNNLYHCFTCHSRTAARFLKDKWKLDRKSFYLSNELLSFIESGGDWCKRCFLRGFFEGDGSACKTQFRVDIAARIDFDWTNIIKLIPANLNFSILTKKGKDGSSSGMQFCRDAPLFYQYIYNSPFTSALKRKKNIVLAHFAKPYYKDKYGELEQ